MLCLIARKAGDPILHGLICPRHNQCSCPWRRSVLNFLTTVLSSGMIFCCLRTCPHWEFNTEFSCKTLVQIQFHSSHHISSKKLSVLEVGRSDPFLVCAVLVQIGVCFSFGRGDVLSTDSKEGVFKSRHELGRTWWHSPTRRKADCIFLCLSIFPATDKLLTL